MKTCIHAAVQAANRIYIEVDESVVRIANVKNGTLFEQILTEHGILLKRIEREENKEDVGGPAYKQDPYTSQRLRSG